MQKYIRLKDKQYPFNEMDIRNINYDKTFGIPFEAEGYAQVLDSDAPKYDSLTQFIEEGIPVLKKGIWVQTWKILELSDEEKEIKQKVRINNLWKSAFEYVDNQISGSISSLVMIGAIQGLPKCMEVKNWIDSIWTEYYNRKLSGSNDLDFTSFGMIPFTVFELNEELKNLVIISPMNSLIIGSDAQKMITYMKDMSDNIMKTFEDMKTKFENTHENLLKNEETISKNINEHKRVIDDYEKTLRKMASKLV